MRGNLRMPSPPCCHPFRYTLTCVAFVHQGESMDSASKIACGLVGAAFVLVGGLVAYDEYNRVRTVHAIEHLAGQFQSDMDHAARDARKARLSRARQKQAQHRRRIASRTLADFQQCRGHTVIDVHGSSYVQRVGADHKPVRCSGRLAAEPLR